MRPDGNQRGVLLADQWQHGPGIGAGSDLNPEAALFEDCYGVNPE